MKFTIVTCTFNAEHELQRTLDSVFQQSHTDVEHLILDGLSCDGTVEMAQAYKQRSDEARTGHDIIVCSERDKGLYDAMNKGIIKATGDYIVFLNAGDTFPSESTLEHIAHCLGDGEALPGVIYGDTNIVNDEGRFLHRRRLQPPANLTWRSFKHGMLVCHQSFYVRADLAKELRYNLEYRFSADFDWTIRIMREAERRKLSLLNSHLVLTDYLSEGMTTRNRRRSLFERFHIMAHYYGLGTTVAKHLWFVVRALIH